MFDRTEHCRRIGQLGGNRTVERYGANYMRDIGRRGAAVTIRVHGVGYWLGIMEGKGYRVGQKPSVAVDLAAGQVYAALAA